MSTCTGRLSPGYPGYVEGERSGARSEIRDKVQEIMRQWSAEGS